MAALCPSLLDWLIDGSMDALKCYSRPSVGHVHLFCQAATFSKQESCQRIGRPTAQHLTPSVWKDPPSPHLSLLGKGEAIIAEGVLT